MNYAFIVGDKVLETRALHSYKEAEEWLNKKKEYAHWYNNARIFLEIPGNKNPSD